MTVKQGPDTRNEKAVYTRYPVTSGLTLGTTKIEGRKPYLKPLGLNGKKSLIKKHEKEGI